MENSCIFCKIIANKIPSKKIKETDSVLVIQDIVPKAPTHLLILPKKHIINLAHAKPEDFSIITDTLKMAHTLSEEAKTGFNLISNNGADVGQSVLHLHWHFLAGKNFYKEGGLKLD